MRAITLLLVTAMLVTALSSAYAEKHYYRIPFNTSMTADDVLIINYDFSAKNGIRCAANSDQLVIDFKYKGRKKTAKLPVTLQSAHIPDATHEELADIKGQFSLAASKDALNTKLYEISCDYINGQLIRSR